MSTSSSSNVGNSDGNCVGADGGTAAIVVTVVVMVVVVVVVVAAPVAVVVACCCYCVAGVATIVPSTIKHTAVAAVLLSLPPSCHAVVAACLAA